MALPLSLLALLGLAASPSIVRAANPSPGSFVDAGDTLVSAMMMFLGNDEKVYILDKAEGNAAQINGHPAWGSVWDIKSHNVDLMDVKTNVFCASGMHLPNGSFATFGGNGAVTVGGNIGSVKNDDQVSGFYDETYQNYDGAKAIRILNPCTSKDNFQDPKCQWFDDPTVLSMQKKRWYSAAEPLANGTIVMIGGYVNGGYVNRNFPNIDPEFEGGAAEPTYEFFPSNGQPAQTMQFMIKTSGLNSYAHTFMMPSGHMFVQANFSTMLWDVDNNVETPLPDMPGQIIRVYPASGAVAMLPLTPENEYNPTILFCGGSDMPPDNWGDYANPAINTWEYGASKDCQRITPEPTNGGQAAYEQDDDMPEGRTMGQFIILPDGKMLVVNGGEMGTAGYAEKTGQTPTYGQMPFGMSLAAQPVLKPAIYNPSAPKGSRWSNAGFQESQIPRLYHSSAILLPDASVLIAGSNPNVDVNLTTTYPTTYKAEIWYPPYFSATTRPAPSGIPETLSYGGNAFDVKIPASGYSGSANDAAENTTVVIVRGGWTTHGMNMGQRFLQLQTSYTVEKNGDITMHCAQMPPNANIFQPGPALFFVVVNGVPSVGKTIIVGSGNIETQPLGSEAKLPENVRVDSAKGSADGSSTNAGGGQPEKTGSSKVMIIGGIVAAIVILGIVGAIVGICMARRKRANRAQQPSAEYAMSAAASNNAVLGPRGMRASDSSSFVPLQENKGWDNDGSQVSLHNSVNYRDDLSPRTSQFPQQGYTDHSNPGTPRSGNFPSHQYSPSPDPYTSHPQQVTYPQQGGGYHQY